MIKFVDMFSGIGGFREGLTRAGGFECVGHCEIDKYANRSYNALFDTKGEWFIEDARKADPSTMPDFQLLCGGFPCQTFSIAGSRKGFGDPRGTLFFELARLAEARKPSYLLFENVPGLLSHDGGRTFATILNTLDRLGYGVEWQSFANSPSPRADQLRAKGERPSVRMELSDITAYLRRKVEPPKDRMPKMPVKIKRKEKTL